VGIKPYIVDDYPAALRAASGIKGVNAVCVLLKKYTGEGATLDQVKEMFRSSGILLIQESEFLSS